ncbi:T9SS type A sorting domain-containing protein [Fulvivirgaceae bacterium BMA10]|uniref:T9SS type A sorting domain-containing protein n=1 Tax=Splendidivirga corallicola TaxID=3051826 RepID=A0ABT8KQ66_9BACT|nr:T9SS type A sorting domain-containing protein [Fulvivirgaceae bacterium BMA10]
MKNLLKQSFLVLLAVCSTLGSVQSFANGKNDDPEKGSEKLTFNLGSFKDTNKIILGVENNTTEKITIKFYDESGKHIFTDTHKNTKKMLRKYDFSANGPGTYTVKIVAGDVVKTDKFEVGASSKAQEAQFGAYFSSQLKGGKIHVSYYNAEKPVRLKISDANGKQLFSQVLSKNADFSSYVNVSKLAAGDYTMSLESNGQSIENELTIN